MALTQSSPPASEAVANKIVSLDELGDVTRRLREGGSRVVMCHGVFDLLHLGHIRHLEAAREFGDVLVVTVSSDKHVNKGPGRPVFAEAMRAEMLAALQLVDWVAVSDYPNAEVAVQTVLPSFYVKGDEYENASEDVTGNIEKERLAVESGGGELVFTHEVVFSSSSLINRHLDVYDPALRDHLSELREDGALERIRDLLDRAEDMHVVLVGDTIIDEYQYVEPLGKSAKENIIATQYLNRELFAGGIIAAANHLAGFCGRVTVITCLGELESHDQLIHEHLSPNVRIFPVEIANAPTTRKTRFVDPSYMRKLFEVYRFDDTYPGAEEEAKLMALIDEHVPGCDLVIATDFGHGALSPAMIEKVCELSPFLAVNAQTNAGNHGFNPISKYPRADYVCIDAPEARLAVYDKRTPMEELIRDKLTQVVECSRFAVTQGKNGSMIYDRADDTMDVLPALTRNVLDTVGAGDAYLVLSAMVLGAGGSMRDAAFVGNLAGAAKVGIVGHRQSLEKPSLVKSLTALLK